MSIISASDDMHANETSDKNITPSGDNNKDIDNQTVPENITKEKIKTKVQDDQKAVKYKKST